VTDLAIVDDDRMLIEGLRAWTLGSADLWLSGGFPTVDAFCGRTCQPVSVRSSSPMRLA
jgi:hypothetical protein